MPNKDSINKSFLLIILATCGFASRTTLAQFEASFEASSYSPCTAWESEPERLIVGHLCVVAGIPGDERPRYVQHWDNQTFKFLFSPGGLALVVEPSVIESLQYDKTKRDDLLMQLTEDRVAIWHDDAIYWWHWLESSNKPWTGTKEE